jgi:hypothetical protein
LGFLVGGAGGSFFVEWGGGDFGGEGFVAALDFQGGVGVVVGCPYIGEGDGVVEAGGVGAAGDGADLLVFAPDGVAFAGGAFAVEGEADELFGGAVFEVAQDGVAADEGFLGVDEQVAGGGDGGAVGGEFVAVEGVADFEAEGVAGAEAGGLEVGGGEQGTPDGGGGLGGEVPFVAPFAGVAGAADQHGGAGPFGFEGVEVAQVGEGLVVDGFDGGAAGGALDVDFGPGGGEVGELGLGGEVGLDPGGVGGAGGGVDDEQEAGFGEAVAGEVVEDAAGFVEQVAVAALADAEGGDVLGEQVFEVGRGGGAGQFEFAHVGDVEDGGVLAGVGVFGEDAGVLDGHVPAAEGGDAGVEGEVFGVEWSLFIHGGRGGEG